MGDPIQSRFRFLRRHAADELFGRFASPLVFGNRRHDDLELDSGGLQNLAAPGRGRGKNQSSE